MKWNMVCGMLVIGVSVLFPPCAARSADLDFFAGVESIADALAPHLKKRTTAVGLIKEKKTGSRLRLSDSLADELSVALKNKGIEVVITEQRLDKADQQEFRSGVVGVQALILGLFEKWGKSFAVTTQAVDTSSGEVIAGKTVRITDSDIPAEMLEPVLNKDSVFGQGTASIQYQCLPDEKPCPPDVELKRRAVDAARMMAMEDLATQTGVSLSAVNQVVSGRAGNKVIDTTSAGQLRNLKIHDPVIQGDEVIIKLTAEITPSNSVAK